MAFRRSFKTRRRTFRRARRLSPFSRKRYDTVIAFNQNRCDPLVLPFHSCPNEVEASQPQRIVLVDNSVVEFQTSDSAVLTSLKGFIKFNPFYQLIQTDAINGFNERALSGYQFAGGVRRVNEFIDLNASQPGGFDDPIADPLQSTGGDDFTDIRWYRYWNKQADSADSLTIHLDGFIPGTPLGVCSDTSAAAAGAPANTLSNGSGTINIPAISTTCSQFLRPGSIADPPVNDRAGASLKMAPPFTLFFNIRRRIPLKRKNMIVLDFNYLPAGSNLPGAPAVAFALFGQVKATLQI